MVATSSVAVSEAMAAAAVAIAFVIVPVILLAATEVGLLSEETLRKEVELAFSVDPMRCAIEVSRCREAGVDVGGVGLRSLHFADAFDDALRRLLNR